MTTRALSIVLAAGIVLAACGSDSPGADDAAPARDAIRVGSFDFAESVLVAEVYAQALEAAGFAVDRQPSIGPREVVAPALESGLLDVVPEYLGTARGYFAASSTDEAAVEQALRERGLTLLEPAPAQDVNVFVVTTARAEEFTLRTVGDIASLPPERRLGGPVECPDRPLCLQGLEQTYGLSFGAFVPLRSLDLTAEALRRDEIEVGVMFSTAAPLDASEFVVLEDDLGLQPPENLVPLVRADAIATWGPGLARALDRVSAPLTTATLQGMNREVDAGLEPAVVAAAWLDTIALAAD